MLLIVNKPLSVTTERAVSVVAGDRIEFVVWDRGIQGYEAKKFSGIYRYCDGESINVDELLLFTGDYYIGKIDYPTYDALARTNYALSSNVQAEAKCGTATSNLAVIMPQSFNFAIEHLADVKVVTPVQDDFEVTAEMVERDDAIDNAVNNCIRVLTQCDQPWNMQIISAVTKAIRATLNTFNIALRQPAVVSEQKGSENSEDTTAKKFLVVVTSQNVRDLQIARKEDLGPMDEGWSDFSGCEVLLGIVKARNKQEAIARVSDSEKLAAGVLGAYAM